MTKVEGNWTLFFEFWRENSVSANASTDGKGGLEKCLRLSWKAQIFQLPVIHALLKLTKYP